MKNLLLYYLQKKNVYLSRAISRAQADAQYSNFNWGWEIRGNLSALARAHSWNSLVRPVFIEHRPGVFQLDLHTDKLFAADPASDMEGRGVCGAVSEKPASFVASCHPNGTITFVAYGHSSPHGEPDIKHAIIDFVSTAWDLAGEVGSRRMRQSLLTFEKLSLYTMADVAPTKRSGSFLQKLESKTHHYEFVFEDRASARREKISREAAFAAGLAGGLISSAVFPLLVVFGQDSAQRAIAVGRKCGQNSKCLDSEHSTMYKNVGDWLGSGAILLAALLLTIASLWVIRRYLRMR